MNQAGVIAWAIWAGVAWDIVEILHIPPAYEEQHNDSAEETYGRVTHEVMGPPERAQEILAIAVRDHTTNSHACSMDT
jgi:hypothetical protein